MLKTLLVVAIGLFPALLSLWALRKTEAKRRAIRQALTSVRVLPVATAIPSDRYYLEGVGYLVGDISCRYNARTGNLRCAVNPTGPCQDCHYYESLPSS
ncbi:MAG: hypothetical protein H0X31_24135 [Nostocaceae cyanobacterium]|nr:hypothetical protein [Nostocaceae cyanobacterium]